MAKLKINQNLTLYRPIKIAKRRKAQYLTYEKPSKLTKRENLTPQKQLKTTKQEKSKNNQQQLISKNKERIEIIREKLKELGYKLLKSELKEIKGRLYIVENKKVLLGSKKPRKYLDELDEKFRKLDKYYHDDDFEFRGIRNIQDLFNYQSKKIITNQN